MVEVDPMIVSGYVVAVVALVLGIAYGVYKALRGE